MTRADTDAWPDGLARPQISDIDGFWTRPIPERAAAFAALRTREPVSFHPQPAFELLPTGPGYWALTRLGDVAQASRTPRIFTSGAGSTSLAEMPVEFLEFFGSMINLDDPRHARLLASFFILLAVAGNETTRNAISWGIQLLTENPEQRAAWLADLDGMTPTAVEEIVRWSSPVIFMRRTLAADAVLGGQPMAAGDKVALFYWAANRDPAHFADPDTFDVRRTPNPHIGFGGPGPHFCLGAHLARREIGAMFRELLTRVPDIHATAPPQRLRSMFINGIKHLPVAFTVGKAST